MGVGNFGEMVIFIVKKEYVDVIICGCCGLGKFWWIFIGIVSDYIVYYFYVFVVVCCYFSYKDEI